MIRLFKAEYGIKAIITYGQHQQGNWFARQGLELSSEAREQMKYIMENTQLWYAIYNRTDTDNGLGVCKTKQAMFILKTSMGRRLRHQRKLLN